MNPPKPRALKILHGNPGKRKLRDSEPTPDVIDEMPRCPSGFSKAEQKCWKYYAPILMSIRVLTVADLRALETLAKCTAERESMEAKLAVAGPLYEHKATGFIQVSPIFTIVSNCRKRELELLREFGLTPSARTRVAVSGSSRRMDDVERLLA